MEGLIDGHKRDISTNTPVFNKLRLYLKNCMIPQRRDLMKYICSLICKPEIRISSIQSLIKDIPVFNRTMLDIKNGADDGDTYARIGHAINCAVIFYLSLFTKYDIVRTTDRCREYISEFIYALHHKFLQNDVIICGERFSITKKYPDPLIRKCHDKKCDCHMMQVKYSVLKINATKKPLPPPILIKEVFSANLDLDISCRILSIMAELV
jgi:hypothetical protein